MVKILKTYFMILLRKMHILHLFNILNRVECCSGFFFSYSVLYYEFLNVQVVCRPRSAAEEDLMLQLIYVVAYFLSLTLVFALKSIYFLCGINTIKHSLLSWGMVLFVKSVFSKHFLKTLRKVKHF